MGAFDFLRTELNRHGYHGAVTSSIDWCELNYHYSYYIAEFINTLTNVPVILLGLYCAYATIAAGVPARYCGCYLGLAFIGMGSFGFHCSLKWEWQLMDELPMIYVSSFAAYIVLDTRPGFQHRFGCWGPLAVLAWCIFVTVSYVKLPNPVYHQVAFASIMLTAVSRSVWLIYQLPEKQRSKYRRSLLAGVGWFVLGFAIWNADNYFCVYLRDTRQWLTDNGVGFLGHFTEGHGYWHLLTGYGALQIFTACTALCLVTKTCSEDWDFDPNDWFPVVRPTKEGIKKLNFANKPVDAKAASAKPANGANKPANGTDKPVANGNGVKSEKQKPTSKATKTHEL